MFTLYGLQYCLALTIQLFFIRAQSFASMGPASRVTCSFCGGTGTEGGVGIGGVGLLGPLGGFGTGGTGGTASFKMHTSADIVTIAGRL